MARAIDPRQSRRLSRLFSSAVVALGVAGAAGGCVGKIGDSRSDGDGGGPNGTGSVDAPTQFTCDPNKKAAVGVLRARSTTQYQNTISDLVS